MGELIFNAIVAALAIAMFAVSYTFPVSIIDKSGGAGLFPRAVVLFLLAFLLIRTLQILRSPEERARKFVFTEIFKGARLVYLLSTLAYFLLVKYVGFILTTVVYLAVMIVFFYKLQEGHLPSRRSTAVICVSSAAGAVLLDYLFCHLMGVLLPAGLLGF